MIFTISAGKKGKYVCIYEERTGSIAWSPKETDWVVRLQKPHEKPSINSRYKNSVCKY